MFFTSSYHSATTTAVKHGPKDRQAQPSVAEVNFFRARLTFHAAAVDELALTGRLDRHPAEAPVTAQSSAAAGAFRKGITLTPACTSQVLAGIRFAEVRRLGYVYETILERFDALQSALGAGRVAESKVAYDLLLSGDLIESGRHLNAQKTHGGERTSEIWVHCDITDELTRTSLRSHEVGLISQTAIHLNNTIRLLPAKFKKLPSLLH